MALGDGVDAARIRIRILKEGGRKSAGETTTALATAASCDTMSIIITTIAGVSLGDRLSCEIDVRASSLQLPVEKTRSLFGVDPALLTAEERRWLRQAVLFALEARDAGLRADRLHALGVGQ